MQKGTFLVERDDAGGLSGCVYVEAGAVAATSACWRSIPSGRARVSGGRLVDAAEQYVRDGGARAIDIASSISGPSCRRSTIGWATSRAARRRWTIRARCVRFTSS